MQKSPSSKHVAAIAVALAVIAGAVADAHRRDEYLQAARLDIHADRVRVELDLTPGIAVAAGVISGIDLDASGIIDTGEIRTYTQHVLRDITLEMDGVRLALTVIGSRFPTVDSMRLGESAIRIDLAATVGAQTDGPHRLHYRNIHRSDVGAYLANALVPTSNRVVVTSQQRDYDQRDLVIDWTLHPTAASRLPLWLSAGAVCGLIALGVFWWRYHHVRLT